MKRQPPISGRSPFRSLCASLPAALLFMMPNSPAQRSKRRISSSPTVTAVSAGSQRQEVTIEFSVPMHLLGATEIFNYVLYDSVTLNYLNVVWVFMRDARTAEIETT